MVKSFNIAVKTRSAQNPSAGKMPDSNTIGHIIQSWLDVRLSREIPRSPGGVLRQMWQLNKACSILYAAHAQLTSSGAGVTTTAVMSTRMLSFWSLSHVQTAHVPVTETSLGLSRMEMFRCVSIKYSSCNDTNGGCWVPQAYARVVVKSVFLVAEAVVLILTSFGAVVSFLSTYCFHSSLSS